MNAGDSAIPSPLMSQLSRTANRKVSTWKMFDAGNWLQVSELLRVDFGIKFPC